MLFYQFRLKTTILISRSLYFKLAIFGLQGLAGGAIAAMGAIGLIMFVVTKMMVKFSIITLLRRSL